MNALEYTIAPEHDGMSVEKYLKTLHGYSSRTLIKLKQRELGISINGAHARTIDLLRAGDILRTAILGEECPYVRSNRRVPVLYEDAHLVVFDKPPDMPCHTSCGHYNDTLVNVFAAYCDARGIACRFRALNRLDRDTSGCVLVAKNQYAASRLTGNFDKTYTGMVCGQPEECGVVDIPILRPDPVSIRRVASPLGQRAVTLYTVAARAPAHSLVRFELQTGRTHQIRVHMAHLGMPLAGDSEYGGSTEWIARQALHCESLRFVHPVTGVPVQVCSPLPQDILDALRQAGFEMGKI